MANEKQRVCIHTDVIAHINNSIKIVNRVYLIKPSDNNQEQTYSKPMNFKGWTCTAVVKDSHKAGKSEDTYVDTEYEIWVNNKNLDLNSTLFKGSEKQSLESNIEQDTTGRYQMVINYTTRSSYWNWNQNDSKEAEMTFIYLCDCYLENEYDSDDCLIKCEDFEEDKQYNEDGSLKYAYAKDHEGNIIFGVYDTQNK